MQTHVRNWALGLAVSSFLGCGHSADDLVGEAKMRLVARDFEGALAKYDEALKADAKNYNALWGKAQALGNHGNFPEQQKIYEGILDDAGLKEKYGKTVAEALDLSYRTAAANFPKEAEVFLKKAIARNPKTTAKSQLARVFMEQGERGVKAGDFVGAKAQYDLVAGLDVAKKLKREAADQADVVGFLAFRGEFQPDLDKQKPELIKGGQLDAGGSRFVVEATADVVGGPKDEGFEANSQKAADAAARKVLSELTYKIAGAPGPKDALLAFEETDFTVDSKGLSKGNRSYAIKLSVPVDAVVFQIYRLRFPVAAKPSAEAEAKAEPPK